MLMEINIRYLVEGVKGLEGIVVIVDVLRTCTTIPILFKQGAEEIIPVGTIDDIVRYEKSGYVLVGEGKQGYKHDAFHYNNSPSEVSVENFSGKKIVIRSNNATQAIINTDKAENLLLASFVNLNAVVDYINRQNAAKINIVALGRLGKRSLEDDLCAEAIKKSLEGKSFNFEEMKEKIKKCDCAILVSKTLNKPKDLEMALKLNSYPVVPRVVEESGVKIIIPAK